MQSFACRCVPSLFSAEAGLIIAQGGLLVCRTLLTDTISRIEAKAGRYLIAQASKQLAQETVIGALTCQSHSTLPASNLVKAM